MTGRPRYADEVDQVHVGRRVSLRHLVDDGDRQRPTDVVGTLVAADPRSFTVVRRSGETVLVDRARLVASRLLPPAQPRRVRDESGPRPSRPDPADPPGP